jgi:aminoglycoside phosphotransferase (APT) family kinase protein
MISAETIQKLQAAGLLASANPYPSCRALSGGVSCEILLVEGGEAPFVIKRALPKLRVKDEWLADTSRNYFEQAYLRFVGDIAPGSVPRILLGEPGMDFFVMEHLGRGWTNWKTELLGGRIDSRYADTAGATLALIHGASWEREDLRRQFNATENFRQLRLQPYLVTTGSRNPEVQPYLVAETERLTACSIALMHGDFSPKNILLQEASSRIAILDCEVACFADPAFDLAFFLNHLVLKALHLLPHRNDLLALGASFLAAYQNGLGPLWSRELEERSIKLLLMLMLARIDGKSPVEYLSDREDKKEVVRLFTKRRLPNPPVTFAELSRCWTEQLTLYEDSVN